MTTTLEREKKIRRKSRRPSKLLATPEQELAMLRHEVKDLRRRNLRLADEEVQRLTVRQVVADALAEAPPVVVGVVVQKSLSAPVTRKPSDVAIACYPQTDWHTGLEVKPGEIQDYNSYSWKIAERRRREALGRFIEWLEMHRQVYDIRECVVPGLGDWNDGTIHLENLMFCEFSTPQAAVRSGQALGGLLLELANHFKVVRYEGLGGAGNHDRIFVKPIYTGNADWSWTTVVHEVARDVASRASDKIVFNVHQGVRAEFSIRGKVFLADHGDSVRTYTGGLPWYGMQHLQDQEARRRAAAHKPPVDYFLFGHWHQEDKQRDRIVLPSLCGTTPYDHKAGRYSPPGQTCFLIGRRGVFNYMCMDLS